MKSLFLIILFILPVAKANDCPLPNSTHVLAPLKVLLQNSAGDGPQTFSPTITESIQYICLAQGNMINTYKTVSVIATYTPNPEESSETSIFQLMCSNSVWTADTSGLADPDSSVINATTRTDCAQCRHNFGNNRCRSCNDACNTGLMRCTGLFSDECCLTFTSSGQCSNTLSCSSSGANFIANADNGYFCSCIEGYTGSNCSENINDCHPNPCENGASCKDEVANYSCLCLDGYTGRNCSTDINDCDPNPCENGATCMDQVADYSCLCLDGYSGKNCSIDINDCDPNPCENRANCTDKVADYSCLCLDGYTGKNCSIDINDCDPNPCHGTNVMCKDEVADYSCFCLDGYTGINCSININDCDPNPCKNGAPCTDKIADYSCLCLDGYTGKNCMNNINDCDPNPCQYGATCHDEVAGYRCVCLNGFRGKNCAENIDDCDPNPCVKGICHDDISDYICSCEKGYYGKNCSLTSPTPTPTSHCTLTGCEKCDGVRPGCCEMCSADYSLTDSCNCVGMSSQDDSAFPHWAIFVAVAIPVLLIFIIIDVILLIIFFYRKKAIHINSRTKKSAVLYEDANEMVSKCTQGALRNKATLTQSSHTNEPIPTSQDIYESLDEQESHQNSDGSEASLGTNKPGGSIYESLDGQDSHQNSPWPQNISLGTNPSYSKVILKADITMETEHNPAYQQMSNLAGMITQNPSEVVGIESNPSYQAHTSIAGHESIDLPLQHNAAYQQLVDVGVIIQNSPEDMGIESNPSYQACTSIAGHKSIDLPLQHNAAYQQMSNVGVITQNSPEDMGIEPNPSYTATRHHLSNPQLQRNATYETIDEVKIPNDPVSTHPIYETNIDTAVDTDAKVSEVEDDSYVDADYDANDDINDDVNDDVNDVDYI